MNFADLDSDTKGIIVNMCENTGWTKQKAILALVEFGMVSMMAAISPDKRDKMMKKIYDAVNNDNKLINTAQDYKRHWDLF